MSWTPDRNGSGSASPSRPRGRTAERRPDALSRAANLHGLADLLSAGLTVIWKDELEALHRDRKALATLRKEAIGLRLDVLLLQCDLDRCRYELELSRGW